MFRINWINQLKHWQTNMNQCIICLSLFIHTKHIVSNAETKFVGHNEY